MSTDNTDPVNDARCSCGRACGLDTRLDLDRFEDVILWSNDQWLASLLMWVWTREEVAMWWKETGR